MLPDDDSSIATLQEIAGLDDTERARSLLEAYGGRLEVAASSFFEHGGDVDSAISAAPSQSSASLRSRAGGARAEEGLVEDTDAARADGRDTESNANSPAVRERRPDVSAAWVNSLGLPHYLRSVALTVFRFASFGLSIAASIAGAVVGVFGFSLPWPGVPSRAVGELLQGAAQGGQLPRIYQGTLRRAMVAAQQSYKFTVVYLHAGLHEQSGAFVRDVLCEAEVRSVLDANFVLWAADVASREGRAAEALLAPSQYPFCAVVAAAGSDGASHGAIRVVARAEGAVSASGLTTMLESALHSHGTVLAAERARVEEQSAARQLREEQDREYERALAADREREREAAAAAEAAREAERRAAEEAEAAKQAAAEEAARAKEAEAAQERARADRIAAAKARLAPEPTASADDGVVTIAVQMPDGHRARRKFTAQSPLASVYDFVDAQGPASFNYCLCTSMPRRAFRDRKQTLEDAGLAAQCLLFIENED